MWLALESYTSRGKVWKVTATLNCSVTNYFIIFPTIRLTHVEA